MLGKKYSKLERSGKYMKNVKMHHKKGLFSRFFSKGGNYTYFRLSILRTTDDESTKSERKYFIASFNCSRCSIYASWATSPSSDEKWQQLGRVHYGDQRDVLGHGLLRHLRPVTPDPSTTDVNSAVASTEGHWNKTSKKPRKFQDSTSEAEGRWMNLASRRTKG